MKLFEIGGNLLELFTKQTALLPHQAPNHRKVTPVVMRFQKHSADQHSALDGA